MSAAGQETIPKAGGNPIQVTVLGKAKLGTGEAMAEFDVELGYKKERLYAALKSEKGIGLEDLLTVFASQVELPHFLKNGPRVTDFHISYGGREASKEFEIGLATSIQLSADLQLQLALEARSTVAQGTDDAPAQQTLRFAGIFQVAGHQFQARFAKQEELWRLFASYVHVPEAPDSTRPPTARDLVAHFLPRNLQQDSTVVAVLDFLGDIQILQAALGLDRATIGDRETSRIFGFLEIGIGQQGSKVQLAFLRSREYDVADGKNEVSGFACCILSQLSFMQLPMVGEQLDQIGFHVQDLGISYSSFAGKVDFPALEGMGNAIPQGLRFNPGLQFLGKLSLPKAIGDMIPIGFASEEEAPLSAQQSLSEALDSTLPVPAAASAISNSPVKWFDVNKTLGPVTVGKVGMRYADGSIGLLLSAGFKLGGIEVAMEGLGLAIALKDLFAWNFKAVHPSLDGLGISFKQGSLEISGMLVKVPRYEEVEVTEKVMIDGKDSGATRVVKQRKEVLEFTGGVQVKIKPFAVSGLGSYTTVQVAGSDRRAPSFFIYAAYNGPIGGPAFFFVTGIALGFGFNRRLRLPTVAEVPTFPLVSIVMGTAKGNVLFGVVKELIDKAWIPSSPGDYWLAIGIRFTSFKIIDTFVLLSVQFGTRMEFGLIGLSRIQWPDPKSPVISIELAIIARFAPDTGLIQVEGLLMNSFIFDKNCKLSGGFAFYAWVSGEHEGDFVVSLGGYHPKFVVPAHYPKVDRLALSWQLSDVLRIYGEMYFALTPRAIMAGGKWEVAFDIGFLKASVLIWANILIGWAPFYYEIDGGIIVKIEASIKIGFFRVSFRLQLGAQVHIWGPPFAGQIYVDWTIFSFTIPFGNGVRTAPKSLTWDQFSAQFVPKEKPVNVKAAAGVLRTYVLQPPQSGQDKAPLPQVPEEEVLLVNPNDFVLFADSFFPLTEIQNGLEGQFLQAAKGEAGGNGGVKLATAAAGQDLYIKPMSVEKAQRLVTKPSLKIRIGETEVQWDVWYATKGAPDALWGKPGNLDPADHNDGVLKELVSGIYARPPIASEATYQSKAIGIEVRKGQDPQLQQAQLNIAFEATRAKPTGYAALKSKFPGWHFPVAEQVPSNPLPA